MIVNFPNDTYNTFCGLPLAVRRGPSGKGTIQTTSFQEASQRNLRGFFAFMGEMARLKAVPGSGEAIRRQMTPSIIMTPSKVCPLPHKALSFKRSYLRHLRGELWKLN
jgi:hypothetical protein